MSDQVRATVRVEFVLEFHAGPWGLDCDLAQVVKQAQDGARGAAEKVLGANMGTLLRCTKIGAPSIHMPQEAEE